MSVCFRDARDRWIDINGDYNAMPFSVRVSRNLENAHALVKQSGCQSHRRHRKTKRVFARSTKFIVICLHVGESEAALRRLRTGALESCDNVHIVRDKCAGRSSPIFEPKLVMLFTTVVASAIRCDESVVPFKHAWENIGLWHETSCCGDR